MNYAIEILLEQKELLAGELEFAEGEERIETEKRLIDIANVLYKIFKEKYMFYLEYGYYPPSKD